MKHEAAIVIIQKLFARTVHSFLLLSSGYLLNFTLLLSSCLVMQSSAAMATSEVQTLFLKKYPAAETTQLNTCATCHSPSVSEGLNGYGLTLKMNDLDFAAVEGFDPDKDGKTSGEEIALGRFPGSQVAAEGLFIFTSNFGKIAFNHSGHVVEDKYAIGGKCATCHSDTAKVTFAKYFDDNTLMKDTAHSVCIGCHKASGVKTAPTSCMDCHKTN